MPDALLQYFEKALNRLSETLPATHGKLALARERLADASRPEDFQTIGIFCRDAIMSLAEAVFSPDFVSSAAKLPPKDKAMPKIDATLAHFGEMAGSEKLRRLARAVLAYALRLQHNAQATSQEAERTVIFTTLALIELAGLVETATANLAFVQRYGVYKCQSCGSTALEEDVAVDVDKEGNPSGTKLLACSMCGWFTLGSSAR
jgi:hypothetical protein